MEKVYYYAVTIKIQPPWGIITINFLPAKWTLYKAQLNSCSFFPSKNPTLKFWMLCTFVNKYVKKSADAIIHFQIVMHDGDQKIIDWSGPCHLINVIQQNNCMTTANMQNHQNSNNQTMNNDSASDPNLRKQKKYAHYYLFPNCNCPQLNKQVSKFCQEKKMSHQIAKQVDD